MTRPFGPLSVLLLALQVSMGNIGLCTGWQPNPDARMACCLDGSCPMHARDKRRADDRPITQAAADGCCAISDEDDASPAGAVGAPPDTTAAAANFAAVAATEAAAPDPDGRFLRPPIPPAHVPRHLLLSVLLV